jgi:hypothetical protein
VLSYFALTPASSESLVNIAHFQKINELGASPKEPLSADTICSLSNTDGRRHHEESSLSDGRYSRIRGTCIRAGQTDKTIGQAPPSGASSFYLAQDTATMKCEVVNVQPAAGGNMKVIGTAHPTHASAETALKADKTCK